MPLNQQIHLDNRPTGEAVVTNFKRVTRETPAMQEGQVLARHLFLSLDSYMPDRMNDTKSYIAAQPRHEVMDDDTVGGVVQSKPPNLPWAIRWWACPVSQYDVRSATT